MRKQIVTLILAILVLTGGTTESFAASSTYTVKRGDSLYSIAKTHHVSVSQIKKWNGLKSSTIHPNQKLKVVNPKAAGNKVATAKTSTKTTKKTPSRSNSDTVVKEFYVSASAYTASCNGCSGITSTGINLKKNPDLKVIAVDPSVIPLGTKVHVEGYGYAVAADKGSAIKGNKIDVFFPSKSDAYAWGRKKVKIKILD